MQTPSQPAAAPLPGSVGHADIKHRMETAINRLQFLLVVDLDAICREFLIRKGPRKADTISKISVVGMGLVESGKLANANQLIGFISKIASRADSRTAATPPPSRSGSTSHSVASSTATAVTSVGRTTGAVAGAGVTTSAAPAPSASSYVGGNAVHRSEPPGPRSNIPSSITFSTGSSAVRQAGGAASGQVASSTAPRSATSTATSTTSATSGLSVRLPVPPGSSVGHTVQIAAAGAGMPPSKTPSTSAPVPSKYATPTSTITTQPASVEVLADIPLASRYMMLEPSVDVRRCLCGKQAAFGLPGTVACKTLGCEGIYHLTCVKMHTAPAKDWRCPTCRVGAMIPMADVACVLGSPIWLAPGDSTGDRALKWQFPKSIAELKAANYGVRLLCMQVNAGVQLECSWPLFISGIAVNNVGIAVPRGPGPAPMLDVTSQCREGSNTITVRSTMAYAQPQQYAAMCVLVRSLNAEEVVQTVLARRAVPYQLAVDTACVAYELASRPGGKFCGISTSDFSTVWRLTRQGASLSALRKDGLSHTSASDFDVGDLPIQLKDVLTLSAMSIPVRGDACKHLNCVDLRQYLQMNSTGSARWKCPYCKNTMMPMHLWVDTLQLSAMRAMSSDPPKMHGFADELPASAPPRWWAQLALPSPAAGVVLKAPIPNAAGYWGFFELPARGVKISDAIAAAGIKVSLDQGRVKWACGAISVPATLDDTLNEDDLDDDAPIPRRSNIPLAIDMVNSTSPPRAQPDIIEILDSDDDSRRPAYNPPAPVSGQKRHRSSYEILPSGAISYSY